MCSVIRERALGLKSKIAVVLVYGDPAGHPLVPAHRRRIVPLDVPNFKTPCGTIRISSRNKHKWDLSLILVLFLETRVFCCGCLTLTLQDGLIWCNGGDNRSAGFPFQSNASVRAVQ